MIGSDVNTEKYNYFQLNFKFGKEKRMEKVKRISIVGGPGTGKSTLAYNLGKKLDLPVYHLDAIDHFENWRKRDKEERDKIILEKIEEPKWIIDGTYTSTLEKRLKKSDLIIFLNYTPIARLKGVLSRYIRGRNREKPDIPGCKEKMELKFIKFTLNWEKNKGRTIKEELGKNKDKNILIFKKRKDLNKWYEDEFESRIEKM